MFMDDRIQPILWSYKTRCLAGHMTTSAVNGGELSGRAVLLRTDLQPRGGKKRWGPDENNCFCCYLATTDRHMLYIALSIANWCSVMTTTCIRALKVYLTRYPASKFKDVFARFTWQRVTREDAFSCCESATGQFIGFTGCYTQMSLICATIATSVGCVIIRWCHNACKLNQRSNKHQVVHLKLSAASSIHGIKWIFVLDPTLTIFPIWTQLGL